jgi:hypothetical protein
MDRLGAHATTIVPCGIEYHGTHIAMPPVMAQSCFSADCKILLPIY